MTVHHCDTCDHYVRDADAEPCALGHKPKWFAPRDEDWASSWDWGWKRDCRDFSRGGLMRETGPYDYPLQKAVDAFYHQHGPCCAGCDHWRFVNAVVGECRRSAPVSGAERWAMVGIFGVSGKAPEAGHIMTDRGHHCGEFVDIYDWPKRH